MRMGARFDITMSLRGELREMRVLSVLVILDPLSRNSFRHYGSEVVVERSCRDAKH